MGRFHFPGIVGRFHFPGNVGQFFTEPFRQKPSLIPIWIRLLIVSSRRYSRGSPTIAESRSCSFSKTNPACLSGESEKGYLWDDRRFVSMSADSPPQSSFRKNTKAERSNTPSPHSVNVSSLCCQHSLPHDFNLTPAASPPELVEDLPAFAYPFASPLLFDKLPS